MVCSDTYVLGSRGHDLWLGVRAGEREPCFLVSCTQVQCASEGRDHDACGMVQKHLNRAGLLLVRACHCFCNTSLFDLCVSAYN